MRYIGLDLAWGERNTTGAAVLESLNDNPRSGATLTATADDLLTDDDVLDFVRTHDDAGGLLIGIDAPLTVPNLTGKRFCEAILSACLRKQEAGPHPANRTLLAGTDGTVRGRTFGGATERRPWYRAHPSFGNSCAAGAGVF